MSKVDIIKFAKAIKRKLKKKAVPYVSYCRRIERVKTNKRICAMTFDDGPTYDSDITNTIIDILNSYNAKGTFDIIGTTEENYPDVPGKLGTPSWSGTAYDHYPKFEGDKNAGAVNCHDLIKKIIDSGHEITNHTFSHILFGKKNIIYSKRHTLNSFDEVYDDVNKLHKYLFDNFNYAMKFSRPPHYVDKIKGGFSSYDIYSKIGYNYLAASFDGAGWLPCQSEEEEIKAMTFPLEKALAENPDALCGQIIFQKDGYNMSLRAPVKYGLKAQLEILEKYGYKVVTVSELLEESKFSDVGRDDPDYEIFSALAEKHAIAFNDNTLRPDVKMSKGELAMLIAPKEVSCDERIKEISEGKISSKSHYSAALNWCKNKGYLNDIKSPLSFGDIEKCSEYFDMSELKILSRRELLTAFKLTK